MRHGTLFMIAAVATGTAAAQAPTGGPLDLQVLETTKIAPGQAQYRVRLANRGTGPILGYVIRLEFFDRTSGKSIMASSQVSVPAIASPGNPQAYGPGYTWEDTFRSPLTVERNEPASSITVDFVKIGTQQNSTNWGPDKGHMSHRVEGMIDAIRLERVRLRRLLSTGGPQALVKDMNR